MVRTLPAVVLLGLTTLAAAPSVRTLSLFRDALRGQWTATVTPDAGAAGKDVTDTLTFSKGGLFSSTEMAKQGYDPTAYDDRGSPIGAAATFEVTLKNAAGDTAHWQASVAGSQMTGTLVITKKGREPESYAFNAAKQ